jgi:hypothetical protein
MRNYLFFIFICVSVSTFSQTIYDWSAVYKTKEFADDYFKYNPYSKQDILELENAFETMPEYKGAITLKDDNGEFLYKDFDDYFETTLKPFFSNQMTTQGVNSDLIPNLIEKYKTEMASNPKIGGKWVVEREKFTQELIDSYSSSYIGFDSTNTATYLKENSNELTNLSLGNYELLFDQKGKLTNYKELNFNDLDSNLIQSISEKGIIIPLPSKINFSIVSNDSILVSTNYYSSTSKDVFFNNTTKSYVFKEIPNSYKVNILNDNFIGKKQIKVVYQFKNDRLANGILLESDFYTKEEIKGILKK